MSETKAMDFEIAYERLVSNLTVLSVDAPPWDPPQSPEQGRLDHYERGRQETWEYFEGELKALLAKQPEPQQKGGVQ